MTLSVGSLGALVTIDEVVEYFRVHRKTVDKWHRARPEFPRKLQLADGSVRFLVSELEEYVSKLIESRDQQAA